MPVGPSGPVVRGAHPATTATAAVQRPKTLPRPSPVRRRPAHPGPAQGRGSEPGKDEGVTAVADQDQETGDTGGAVRRPQEEDAGQARPGRRRLGRRG